MDHTACREGISFGLPLLRFPIPSVVGVWKLIITVPSSYFYCIVKVTYVPLLQTAVNHQY